MSLEISSEFFIFFSLFSFILAWTFISLQIKEFRIMGLSINDSVYSCLFFFLTGLHFCHLLVGLFLCCLLFWCCSFSNKFLIPATPTGRRIHDWRFQNIICFQPGTGCYWRNCCWLPNAECPEKVLPHSASFSTAQQRRIGNMSCEEESKG